MSKINEFWFVWMILGFALGLFMICLVPRTTLINAKHAEQECITVKVKGFGTDFGNWSTQDFCKQPKDTNAQ